MNKVRLVVAVAFAISIECAAAPKKFALLVGIDDYLVVNHLHGCVNDVRDMQNLLRTTYEFDESNIAVLTNAQATRANILARFRSQLIDKAAPGDIVVFHYSGHGSRMPDVSGDEGDQWDETIVPYDSRQGGVFDISDDELNDLLRQLQAKTRNITVILDSCHSGSGVRAEGVTVRQIADDTRKPPAPKATTPRGTREGETDMRELALDYVLIAAAHPTELANESITAEGQERGALTYSLSRILRESKEGLTARELMEEVSRDVTSRFPSQHPQIEGLRLDAIVFGTTERPVAPYALVSPSAGAATVRVGSAYGLAPGALFDIYAPRTRDFSVAPIGQIELTNVQPFESDARIKSGRVEPLSRAVLRANPFTPTPLRIYFDPSVAASAQSIRAALAGYQGIQEAQQAAGSDLILRKSEGIALFTSDLVRVSAFDQPGDPGMPGKIKEAAEHWSRWFQIRAIRNPAPTVTMDVNVRKRGADSLRYVAEGDIVEVTARNTSGEPLYITIVDLSSNGESDPWHPPAGVQDALAPGKELKRVFKMRVPEGMRSITDTIKVFGTTDWIDPSVFRLAALKLGEVAQPRGSALESFVAQMVQGARQGDSVEMKGWTTYEQSMTIRKNPTRLTNFIAHYEGPAAATAVATRAALDCSGDANRRCYDVRPFVADTSVVEIIPGGVRGEDSRAEAAGAWDEAYAIRDTTGAARVEPSLEYEVDEFSPDPEGTRGGLFDEPDKPKAANNNLWSLQHANVFEAWRKLQAKGERDGEEGKGIVVGHPDTGYRKHPEIWSANAAASAIVPADGYDYVTGNSDPFDPLDSSGVLPNPGHGTKSSSVIISPKGKQLLSDPDPNHFVDGIAPGARLIPLRVHRSVVHFNPSRLAQAIYDAASDDRTHVKQKADVISISMGGVPTWALWKAVRYAESRGTIVVAAAGNEVRLVVWPARFKETVAVAASNVDCGIWRGSSRGSAVDITAPGESVWHAQSGMNVADSFGLGKGTTFATATTAGIAALWVDYHRGDQAFERLRANGQATAAFRNALQSASWRPDQDPATWPANVDCKERGAWNTALFGPGIVNAAKTLDAPLAATREAAPQTLDELPLFSSIFPDNAAAVPADRYTAIFGLPRAQLAKVALFEAEVMQQYAMSEEVRAAIDTIVTAQNPSAAQYESVRRALLAQSISSRLRSALR